MLICISALKSKWLYYTLNLTFLSKYCFKGLFVKEKKTFEPLTKLIIIIKEKKNHNSTELFSICERRMFDVHKLRTGGFQKIMDDCGGMFILNLKENR